MRSVQNAPVQSEEIQKQNEGIEVELASEKRLYIEKIHLETEIFEGNGEYTLEKGVWHKPNGIMPGVQGNVILTGHRFGYFRESQRAFFNLDKISVGDMIVIYWDSEVYFYKVFSVFEVEPNNIEIEQSGTVAELTLYTCTPLWISNKRLVVKALLFTE